MAAVPPIRACAQPTRPDQARMSSDEPQRPERWSPHPSSQASRTTRSSRALRRAGHPPSTEALSVLGVPIWRALELAGRPPFGADLRFVR
jgi:hypothetical protein